MNADEVAKTYCVECREFGNCSIPCTSALVELWDELGGKTTVGEMQELIQNARRKMISSRKQET